MTMKIKRVVALMIALMLAVPTFTFAEDDAVTGLPVGEEILQVSEAPAEPQDGEGVPEAEAFALGESEPQAPDAPQTPEAFERTATLNDIVIALTAQPGAFPADAALRAAWTEDAEATAAVEAALGAACAHRLLALAAVDEADAPIVPFETEDAPAVRVSGLGEDVRILAYDTELKTAYPVETRIEDDAVVFDYVSGALFDFVTAAGDASSVAPEGEDASSVSPEGEPEQPEQPEPQKPSPSGEGGAAQSAVTEEVVPEEEPTAESEPEEEEGEATSSVSPEGEPASPEGEASGEPEEPEETEETEQPEQPEQPEEQAEPEQSEAQEEQELTKLTEEQTGLTALPTMETMEVSTEREKYSSVETSGVFPGDTVTWRLEGDTLIIGGYGNMPDFNSGNDWDNNPWWHNRSNISHIVIDSGVTGIGDYAFYGCTALNDWNSPAVSIADTVTRIGNFAFAECTSTEPFVLLSTVCLPNSVTEIGVGAFSNSKKINTMEIPDSVTTIPAEAFSGCEGLSSITIPISVTEIGAGAFSGCLGLRDFPFPNKLEKIGNSAFINCSNLGKNSSYQPIKIVIPDTVTSIGTDVFRSCWNITSIKLPKNLTVIPEEMFYDCRALTTVDIPEGLTTIGPRAFVNCALTELHLPGTLKEIQAQPFTHGTYYTKISDIYFAGTEKTWNEQVGGAGKSAIPQNVTYHFIHAHDGAGEFKEITSLDQITEAGSYFLANDITLTESWNAPDYAVNLCLNGKTITAGENVIPAINVNTGAMLMMCDCADNPGTIACNNEHGKGVCVGGGSFTLKNGTINAIFLGVEQDGGSFVMDGGAISCSNGNGMETSNGSFAMNGGEITGKGMGVVVYGSGMITVNDGTITGEENDDLVVGKDDQRLLTVNGGTIEKISASKVNLSGAPTISILNIDTITITGSLTYSKPIQVNKKNRPPVAGVFTSGWSAEMGEATPTGYFTSGNSDYTIALSNGELSLVASVKSVTVEPTTLALSTDEAAGATTGQLTATILPDDAANKKVTWSSSDEKVATVDENGLVTAVGNGKATITVTTEDGGKTATCAVTVAAPHLHEGINFAPWESTNSLPDKAGNWYLTGDVVLNGSWGENNWTVPNGTVNLCLNGNTVSLGQYSGINIGPGATLNLYDEAAGKGTITVPYSAGNQSLVVVKGGTFHMYAGVINGDAERGARKYPGVTVTGGTFDMSGGTITGTGWQSNGAVYITGGTFNLSGGTITKTLTSSKAGGVYITGGTFNMSDGEITGNSNSYEAGSVLIDGENAVFNLSGGSITGNTNNSSTAYGNHGGVYLKNGAFNLSGNPVISGNTIGSGEGKKTENVYLASGQKITVTGGLTGEGTIGVTLADGQGVFTDTGNSELQYNDATKFASDAGFGVYTRTADEENPGQLYIEKRYTLTYNANGATGSVPGGEYPENKPVSIAGVDGLSLDKFTFDSWNTKPDGSGTKYVTTDTITLTANTTLYAQWIHIHSEGESQIVFKGWSSENSLPTTAGNYALIRDVTLSKTWNVPGGTTKLCLNGHSITQGDSGDNVIKLSKEASTLDLYDCATEPGKITGGTANGQRGVVIDEKNSAFNMYGGSISGNQSGIAVGQNTVFNMYGGSIEDNGNTGVWINNGVFNMYEGSTIAGNKLAVNMDHKGTFTMHGGSITGNAAGVEVFHDDSVFDMKGGAITENNGIGVKITSIKRFSLSGKVTITGNKEDGVEKNVYLDRNHCINISAALDSSSNIGVTRSSGTGIATSGLKGKGTVDSFTSDNAAYVVEETPDGEAILNQSGHAHDESLTFGTPWMHRDSLPTAPGSYYLTRNVTIANTWSVPAGETKLCLNGHSITYTGDNTTAASVIAVPTGATLDLYDCDAEGNGVITGGKGTAIEIREITYTYGGGVLIQGGTFNMHGGTISGNQTGANPYGNGGGVAVIGGAFKMTGGTISGNTAARSKDGEGHGGGVFVREDGAFTMTGGSVTGNTGAHGEVSLLNNCTAVISGAAEIVSENINQAIHTNSVEGTFSLTISGGKIKGKNYGVTIQGGDDDSFTLSGKPTITSTSGAGIFIDTKSPIITVGDTLTNTAPISVRMETPGVFTSGLAGKGNASNFANGMAEEDYILFMTGTGELRLANGKFSYWDTLNNESKETMVNGILDSGMTAIGTAGEETWYAVDSTFTLNSRLKIVGDVNLILCDGTTLTAPEGINVAAKNSLTIWDQAGHTGSLTAGKQNPETEKEWRYGAGIGGNDGDRGNESSGEITINGGRIIAYGDASSAGIGTGQRTYPSKILQTVVGKIIINAGTVEAYGNYKGNGIGAGQLSTPGVVEINGGTVTAQGGSDYGNAIGCSNEALSLYANATVYADSSKPGTRVEETDGTARKFACKDNKYAKIQPCDHASATIVPLSETQHGIKCDYCWSRSDHAWSGQEGDLTRTCAECGAMLVKYYDPATPEPLRSHFCLPVTSTMNDTGVSGGWYAASGTPTFDSRVYVTDNVNLILCDGATMNANMGVEVHTNSNNNKADSLTIWAQRVSDDGDTKMGALIAKGGVVGNSGGAGIGGSVNAAADAGTITIHGGTIRAEGGIVNTSGGTGIGGGHGGKGGTITIDGGAVVTATGKEYSAGIGGGSGGSGGTITIGGTANVRATGGNRAAGIGGGWRGSGGEITIDGATVIATANGEAAGIGGGYNGNSDSVIIRNNATVTATGGNNAAGIGGGEGGAANTITIDGAKLVTATGAGQGAGIGGGSWRNCGTVIIKDSNVTASGISGAGIGNGSGDSVSGGTITISGTSVVNANGSSGAGIGGGNDNKADSVTIDSSATVTATSTNNTAIAANTVTLYDLAKVTAGESIETANPIENKVVEGVNSRVAACGSNSYAKVEPCDPHAINRETGYCRYCATERGHKITLSKAGEGTLKAKVGQETTAYDAALYAMENESVALIATPASASGWRLQSLAAKDADEAPVTIEGNAFTMPGKDVTVTATFEKIPAEVPQITGQPQGATLTYGYETGATLSVTATPVAGHTLGYQWYQGETAIGNATAESYTVPTGLPAGGYPYKCVVTATRTDNGLTASVTSAVATVTVQPKTVTDPTILLDPVSYTYDGAAKEPAVTVKDGETVVPEGEYTVSYKDNISAGTATAIVTDAAGGNYTVGGSATFTIVEPTYTVAVASVEHGALAASHTAAKAGETVTVTATPDAGNHYWTEAVTLTRGATTETLQPGADGKYTFVMPAANVTVDATFATYTVTMKPGAADGQPVPGEDAVISAGDPNIWSTANTGDGIFFHADDFDWFSMPQSPYPAPEGYIFIGWLREGDTSAEVPGSPVIAETFSLTAQWARRFTISAVPTEDFARWIGVKSAAGAGTTVNVMVQMAMDAYTRGVRMKAMTITGADGTVTELTKDVLGTELRKAELVLDGAVLYMLRFEMPMTDVTLRAVFEQPVQPQIEVQGWTYGAYDAATHGPRLKDGTNPGGGAVTWAYKLRGADDATYSAALPVAAGEYTVRASVAAAGYYLAGAATADFAIAKAPLTVTADAQTKEAGRADPMLTYVATGLVAGDALTGALAREPGEAAGAYAITQGTLTAGDNYELTFVGAKLTITARPVKPGYTLLAKMAPAGEGELKLTWTKVAGARGYDVYFTRCGTKTFKKVATVKAPGRSAKLTGLRRGVSYKAYVKAWRKVNGKKTIIGEACANVHSIVGEYNAKWTNAKAVKLNRTKLTLGKKKTFTLTATVTGVKEGREVLHHRRIVRFYSSDTNVAKVSKNGVVTGVAGGVCTIHAIANNGVEATVKVTVR